MNSEKSLKTVEINKVKPEVLAKAQSLVKTIDISKQDSITNLGLETQQKLSSMNNAILDEVRTKDSGEVGKTINELLTQINAIDVDLKPSPLASIPIIGSFLAKMFDKGKEIVSKYESVKTNINGIVLKLDKSRLGLRKDNNNFQTMFEKNVINISDLDAAIVAGKMKVEELSGVVASFSPEDGIEDYEKKDTVNFLDRLEKKVYDLQLTRHITIQSLPQIRLIQSNNQLLEDKILSSINNTIPIWQQQMVIGLGIQRQKNVLEVAKNMDDATNIMIVKNSENLKFNTIEAAKANERGIIDVASLKKVNEDIMSTLDELVKIKEDGKKARQQAEVELSMIESELKNKILTIKQGTSATDVEPNVKIINIDEPENV